MKPALFLVWEQLAEGGGIWPNLILEELIEDDNYNELQEIFVLVVKYTKLKAPTIYISIQF